jgi:hypothetical protein
MGYPDDYIGRANTTINVISSGLYREGKYNYKCDMLRII